MPARERRRPFWSRWVWKDWDAKTKDLDPWEYTAYHRLLSYAATQSEDLCSLPDDDRRLARASGLGMRAWRRVRVRVLAYFEAVETPGGNRKYVHHRLRDDASYFLQTVENNQSRVNRWLNQRTTAGTTGWSGSKKLEVRKEKKDLDSVLGSISDSLGTKFKTASTLAFSEPTEEFWHAPRVKRAVEGFGADPDVTLAQARRKTLALARIEEWEEL